MSDLPPGTPPGLTVYVVMEEWTVPDAGGLNAIVHAVHLTRKGAEANLGPDDKSGLSTRYVVEVETQP